MAIPVQAWPFENIDTTEAQYGQLFRLFQEDGIADPPGSTSGSVTAGSGYTVNVAAIGFAYVGGLGATLASAGTITLDNAAAQARTDRIVLRINSGTNTATVDKLNGVAGSTAAPTLTQNPGGIYEIPLARITIPASALNITSANITDERQWTSRRVLQYTSTTRPVGKRGDFGVNQTTAQLELNDGTGWKALGSDGGQITGTVPTARLDYAVVAGFRGDRAVDAPVSGETINGDWNSILQPGAYRIYAGNSNTNAPNGAYMFGTLVVFGAGATTLSRTQVYYEHGNNGQMYARTAWNGNDWNYWQSQARLAELNQARSDLEARSYSKSESDSTYYNRSAVDGSFATRDARLAGLEASSTPTFTVATGWTVNRVNFWRAGRVLTIDLSVKRTGGSIGAGNIANIKIGDVTGGFGSNGYVGLSSGPGGIVASFYVNSTGIYIAATASSIANNSEVTLGGTYIMS